MDRGLMRAAEERGHVGDGVVIGAHAARNTGFSLLELMLAALCTSLVAGAVLSLLVSSAASARRRLDALSAQAAVDAAVSAIARDLRQLGVGLENARAVWLGGQRYPLVSQDAAGGLMLLLTGSSPLEIGEHLPGGRFLVPAGHGLSPGDSVAAVGQPRRAAGEPLPGGAVAVVTRGVGGDTVAVAWDAVASSMLADGGQPRALLPITVREYATSEERGGMSLRRRNPPGRWQSVADNLTELSITFLLDDPDVAGGARVLTLPPGSEERLVQVAVEAGVETRDGPRVTAAEWVRIRRASQ